MASLLDRIEHSLKSVTFIELLVLFIIFNLTWFYYSNIYTVFYTGNLSHLPHPKYPLYHSFYRFYLRFFGDVNEYSKIHETYGKVVLSAKNVVIVSDIESYKLLNGYKYKKGKLYSAFDLKNPNIFSSREKEFHSKRKRLLSPAFNAKSMQAMEPIILQTGTLNLVDHLSNEIELSGEAELRANILEILYRSTLDVISKLVFGESLNCISNPEDFKYYMKNIFKAQIVLGTSPIFPFIKKYLPTDIFEGIIIENMKSRRSEKTRHSDILQSMMDTQDENTGKKLRDDEIIDEAITLLFAGIDTTSNTLIFTIYEILKNRDLYNRITGQILKEFPDPNAIITVEDCRKRLTLLEATLFESLRFYPVAFGPIPRIVPPGGVAIDGRFIPEDTVIAYNTFAVNRNEENFPTPNEFNIDKWLSPEKEVYKSRLYAFSTGPRGCIGKELAWAEMLLILSHLLHRFSIEMDPQAKITPTNTFLLSPKEKSLFVTFKKRVF